MRRRSGGGLRGRNYYSSALGAGRTARRLRCGGAAACPPRFPPSTPHTVGRGCPHPTPTPTPPPPHPHPTSITEAQGGAGSVSTSSEPWSTSVKKAFIRCSSADAAAW